MSTAPTITPGAAVIDRHGETYIVGEVGHKGGVKLLTHTGSFARFSHVSVLTACTLEPLAQGCVTPLGMRFISHCPKCGGPTSVALDAYCADASCRWNNPPDDESGYEKSARWSWPDGRPDL